MLEKKDGLAFRTRRWADSHPAAALWTSTSFVAIVVVMVSFTPAYATLSCKAFSYNSCAGTFGNPCGIGCQPDNNGDFCTDMPGYKVVQYIIQGAQPNNWPRCTAPGITNYNLRCAESPQSCGVPQYFYKPPGSGSGAGVNCAIQCQNPLFWYACKANSDIDGCP